MALMFMVVVFGFGCSLIVANFDLGWSFMMLGLLTMAVCKNYNEWGLEWVSSSSNLPRLVYRFFF